MRKYKNSLKRKWLNGIILGIFLFVISTSAVMAATPYQTTLAKGTDIYTIDHYNDTAWKSTVNLTSTPNDWFKGESNVLGAESKVTLKGWMYDNWSTYDALTSIILPLYFDTLEIFTLLTIMESQDYNATTINSNYTSHYQLWYGIRSVWNYTYGTFEELPSYTDGVVVLQNPSEYKTMLDDYISLSTDLNTNPIIQFSGFNFPNITADEFLWQMALNGLAIAEPQSEYLTELTTQLGCENVSTSGSALTFERHGVTDYTVVINYGTKGMMSSFTVKDNTDTVIFHLVSSNSDWVFFTILIISCISVGALIAYMIFRSRKLKRR